jgi:hypothetical protein
VQRDVDVVFVVKRQIGERRIVSRPVERQFSSGRRRG